jgi:hypothetical protein
MSDLGILLLVHAGATTAMTGLIWFVQIVHYPLMASVGVDRFEAYERRHMRRTTWVVGPLMLVEASTAVLIAVAAPTGAVLALAATGLALLAWIWLSTAFLQVPCHRRLERGYDERTVARLVVTNWGRTAAWSARCVLAFVLLWAVGVT